MTPRWRLRQVIARRKRKLIRSMSHARVNGLHPSSLDRWRAWQAEIDQMEADLAKMTGETDDES